jgi:PAS domain S-box-containing protein
MLVAFENDSGEFSLENQIEWWKAIVSSINDGILVIDRQGIVRLINPEYTRITGVSDEIIGQPLRKIRRYGSDCCQREYAHSIAHSV